MKRIPYEERIRLAVVLPYYLFHLPLFIRFLLLPADKESQWNVESGRTVLWVLFACFTIYLFLELFEYFAFRFERKGRGVTWIFTAVRFLAWAIPVVMALFTPGIPIIDLLLPFFLFNLYFVLPIRVSFSILMSSLVYTVLIFWLREGQSPDRLAWFMLIPRTMMSFILYAFAHFWENSRRRRRENEALVEKLHSYADGVSRQVALEERTRLARDIHDNLGHYMTVIQIQLSKAEAFFDRDPGETRNSVLHARDAAREAMSEIRQSLDTLNNPGGEFILKEEIQKTVNLLIRNGVKAVFRFTGEQEGCNYAVLLALYRMVQEGVTNILKHSAATEAHIDIDLAGTARIWDNGKGLNAEILADGKGTGFGLTGLASRFALVQGRFSVTSPPEGGTLLSAEFPRDPVKTLRG